MLSKKHIALVLVAVFFSATYFLTTCKTKNQAVHYSHYIDTSASREAQIDKCASCHKDVYDNWKLGPHSNAYLTLESHNLMLDTSLNFPHGYNEYVEMSSEKICMTCHTGQNIFETNFAGVDHSKSPLLIIKDSMPNVFVQAFGRDAHNRKELFTGVDCITCHVQGDQVVTHVNSKASDSLGLIKSHLFSSNLSCFSCHHHQVETMTELVEKKKLPFEISCINCHQEYDAQNKGTHYFYWRNNPESKKRPSHLDIFECVNLSVITANGSPYLAFNWTNKVMPHGYSECGEAKCVVMAVYKDGSEKTLVEKYLNRKSWFDEREMPPHFRIGRVGHHFDFMDPILENVSLVNYNQLDYFVITGYVKPQYWSNEKEFIQIFKKEIPVNLAL